MNSKKTVFAAAIFFSGIYHAQHSQYYTHKEEYHFGLAENLFKTKIYNAAQYEYARQYFYNESLSQSRREAARFFDNIIGVILQKNHAEEGLEAFMKDYPNSAYFAEANLPLADYYLAKKDFDKALESLEKVNQTQLTRQENTQYILKLGYAKFMQGDSRGAIEALDEAYREAGEPEKSDVAYMLGHLYYAQGNTSKAFDLFDAIKTQDKFAKLVRPYYVQMYFNSKDYDRAIMEGQSLLDEDLSGTYKTEVHKIIGESYFMKGDYAAAYPHLKAFLDAKENPSQSDLYEMGFVSAKLGRYEDAVSYYNRLVNSNSATAQNAYYQLGNAYLQTGRKQEALSAFRSAYQMGYDPRVQQLAHEQYAKLSYEIGNPFEAAPKVIQAYISKYPASPKRSELQALLVKSYLYSGDYRETLAAIDKLPNSTPETDKIDQEVSFLLGTEEFNKSNFDEAEKYLLRSLELKENKDIANRALYWLAQTYYQKGNYPSAIVRYERLLNENFQEKGQLNYDLGYAYFKSKKFDQAQKFFKEYLKNPAQEFKSDAELRLADTYYAENKLNEAIDIYNKSDSSDDYTLFQKAMALGFKGDTEAKIQNLKNLISKYPASDYVDDAQYEIASAYAAQDSFIQSNEYFNKVIAGSVDKDLVANAKIYHAQNLIDLNKESEALAELHTLADQYRNTAYKSKIVQAARPIFLKNGDTAGYERFAKNAGVNINAAELQDINLNAARNFYTKKDYQSAIPLYEKYLAQNPSGEGLYQAKYELGESYYQTKNTKKALLVLPDVARAQNDYQQDAQTRLAQIYLAQNNIPEAQKYLETLREAPDANVRNYAHTELMSIYAREQDLKNAVNSANEVLKNTKNPVAVLEKARAIRARNAMQNGKDREAQQDYAALEKSSNTEVAAEALYAKAYYQNKAKAFKSSNETIFKLANNYSAEEYWGAKALLIMAKNYIGLKDKYQATYTLDQIIANYQDFPDVVAEAQDLKKTIK